MQAKERLTIAQADFHHHWGGQGEVVLALSRALADRGHRLIVLCPAQKKTAGNVSESDLAQRARAASLEVFCGCQFTRGFRPLPFWRDYSALCGFLRREKLDIYHCPGSQDHWLGALAIRRSQPGVRVIRTRHNIYPIANNIANRWLFRDLTAQVITIFGSQTQFFTETGLLPAERLVTIPPPLPYDFIQSTPPPRSVRDELNLSNDTPLIGFVANFHPDKAPLDFVALAERVGAACPEAHFAMAGHGPLDKAIREAVSKSPVRERFHMLGFRTDMPAVMASFDLLALTSVTREASSTVLKQAGAAGVPSVATDVGGTREVVADGKTGLIVPPGDVEALTRAALELLRDRPRAAAMGEAARKKILNEFTAPRIAEQTEALYYSVLERANAR